MRLARPAILVGLIGAGIQASGSPALHMQEGEAQGLRYLYRLIDLEVLNLGVESLPTLLAAAEQMRFDGLNITHPCKQAVIPLLHALSDDARALGAVNTVVLRDGRRIGHNTDWWGFAESFRRGLPGANMSRVVLVGGGGGGAAVAYATLKLGAAHLSVFDIDQHRAQLLADRLGGQFGRDRISAGSDLRRVTEEADGLVHATPTGMVKYPGLPLPAGLLRPSMWVAEIVYFPLETALLRAAKAAGCRTLDGGGMAVFQAAEAFRLFTGMEPDVERMARHFVSMGV